MAINQFPFPRLASLVGGEGGVMRGALDVGEKLAKNPDGGFDLGVGQVRGRTQP
jgi:hypothetical protein